MVTENITVICVVQDAAPDIEAFQARLAYETKHLSGTVEFLYVDDSSSESTDQVLRHIAAQDSRVRVLRLSRRFGWQGAVTAALVDSTADATILLAGNRSPVSVLVQLIDKWREGYDIVWAIPQRAIQGNMTNWLTSIVAAIYRRLNLPILQTMQAGLFSRRVLQIFRSFPHRDEDVLTTLTTYGFRQTTITTPAPDERPRIPAKEALVTLGSRLVDNSIVPIRLVSGMGIISAALSVVYALVIIVRYVIFDLGDLGWPSLAITLLFIGGAQLISLGIVAEYIWRIFQQSRQTPRYIIKERLGVPTRTPHPSWTLDPNHLDVSTRLPNSSNDQLRESGG